MPGAPAAPGPGGLADAIFAAEEGDPEREEAEPLVEHDRREMLERLDQPVQVEHPAQGHADAEADQDHGKPQRDPLGPRPPGQCVYVFHAARMN